VALAGAKAGAVAGARLPFEVARERRGEAADVRKFERESLRRFDEARAASREWTRRFQAQLVERDLRDMRQANAQLGMAKFRHWSTQETVKLRHRLAAPERRAKLAAAKMTAEEKGRERTYNRAFARYQRAAEDVQQAVKAREQMDKKMWPEFQKKFAQSTWYTLWLGSRFPGREETDPGGMLEREWNRTMMLPNQAVTRAQSILKAAKSDYDRARNAYLGLDVVQGQPSEAEMRALISKHKGDVEAAKAEWAAGQKG
jgi:hypothetical protein